jgi:hypothetical protein
LGWLVAGSGVKAAWSDAGKAEIGKAESRNGRIRELAQGGAKLTIFI